MRYASKRNSRYVLPALAAAGLGAMLGVPAAHGNFVITIQQINGPVDYPTDASIGGSGPMGAGLTEYVLSALNTGVGGTGTNLLAEDVTINSSANLVIDAAQDVNQDHKADANIAGAPGFSPTATNIGLPGKKQTLSFLSTVTPTFGVYDENSDPNNGFDSTFVSIASPPSNTYGDPGLIPTVVQVNGNVGTAATNAFLSNGTNTPDPAFLNGTVTSLRVVAAYTSASFKGPNASITAVPFANIVVPNGASGTVSGSLAGDQGAVQPFSIKFPVASPGPSMQLASTAIAGSTSIGSITLTGHNGNYLPVTTAVTGQAQTSGALTVAGFTSGDEEVFGLAASSPETLALLAGQLNAALAASDPGATVSLASTVADPGLAAVLAAGGDNLVAIIPGADAGSPDIFSYNLNGLATGSTITSITVVPEPTGIGALVLGGLGLLSRRKRRSA